MFSELLLYHLWPVLIAFGRSGALRATLVQQQGGEIWVISGEVCFHNRCSKYKSNPPVMRRASGELGEKRKQTPVVVGLAPDLL